MSPRVSPSLLTIQQDSKAYFPKIRAALTSSATWRTEILSLVPFVVMGIRVALLKDNPSFRQPYLPGNSRRGASSDANSNSYIGRVFRKEIRDAEVRRQEDGGD